MFPGQSQALASTAAKVIKHRVYQVVTWVLGRGICREELELAHTSRVTIPQQHSVLQVLGTTELSSTSKLAFLSLPCELAQ